MTAIERVTVDAVEHQLSEPFEISLGVRESARNLLVTVRTESGARGYGEGSPLPPVTGETQSAAVAIANSAAEIVEGREVRNYRALVADVRNAFPGAVSATFAVETAILDAYCREQEIPLAELFGGMPETVETDLTIPIVPAEEAASRAGQAADAGFDHLKIKAGNDVTTDVERIAAVHDAAPNTVLKVDANQGWSPKETKQFAAEVDRRGIDLALIEQPVDKDDLSGLAYTRDHVAVPVAADESVFSPTDAVAVVRSDAADILNVKLGKSGPLGAMAIAAVAEAANLELMVGCMLESAVGIHTSAHVVAGLGTFEYVDLDGNLLLAEDVVETAFGPEIHPVGPGHGVTPDR